MFTYFIFIIVLAFAFAKLEIQIEGTAGWAKNLPTWRIEKHWALDIFWGGRALTGYHFWAMLFVFILFHMPLFFVEYKTWNLEFRILGGLILFWLIEDFLWFVINPGYGLKRFTPKNIPWHPRWVLGLPVDYWIFLPIGLGLVLYSY